MIKMRGYENKYHHQNDEVGVISGGVMWESNSDLHFIEPIIGDISDLENAPFNINDLMLGSPYSLNGKTIYEKDIVNFNSGVSGVVKQDKHQGWIVETFDSKYKYELVDVCDDSFIDNIKINTNTYFENDKFTC